MRTLLWWLFRDTRNFWEVLWRLGLLKPETSARLGVGPYPYYHFGLMRACIEAKCLGYKEIYALEFGVAGGRGILELLKGAKALGHAYGVKVHVLGFDSGSGMPTPVDVRDTPYLWTTGDFPMDSEALSAAISSEAQVLIGPVADAVPAFQKKRGGLIQTQRVRLVC